MASQKRSKNTESRVNRRQSTRAKTYTYSDTRELTAAEVLELQKDKANSFAWLKEQLLKEHQAKTERPRGNKPGSWVKETFVLCVHGRCVPRET